MGHDIKKQSSSKYRPSATRRASGLSPIRESSENALKRWNKLRQHIKSNMKLERTIRSKGSVTRGRFKMSNASSPPKKKSPIKGSTMLNKNKPPGIYFVTDPYTIGRFKIENIYGFVPWPTKKSTNAKSP
jgi:hypothetical protein